MATIFNSILPIFLLIAVGVVLEKILPRQPESSKLMCKLGLGSCETLTSVLNRFALYLALPALIISSLAKTSRDQIIDVNLIYFNVAVILAIILISYAVTRLSKMKASMANTYIFGTFFGSVAYVGFPFIGQLYPGNDGVVSILVAIHVIIAFSLGIYILERSKRKADGGGAGIRLLKNPLLISVIIGLVTLSIGITLPAAIATAVSMLGASASPVVLIAMGTFIAKEWKFDKTIWHAATIAGLKIIFMPLVFLLSALLMKQSLALDISILSAGMPVALTNFALAEIYPMNKKIIANAIILSVIVSLVTLAGFSLLLA
jgi:predicted permease